MAQIAVRFECSPQTIYMYLRKHQNDKPLRLPRTRPAATLDVEEVRRLYDDEQLSIRRIAQRLQVGSRTLIAFMEKQGIERRLLPTPSELGIWQVKR